MGLVHAVTGNLAAKVRCGQTSRTRAGSESQTGGFTAPHFANSFDRFICAGGALPTGDQRRRSTMHRGYLSTSLKARLTAVVLAVLFASMIAGILVPSLYTAKALRDQANLELTGRAEALAAAVDHWLTSSVLTVRLLSKSPEMRSMEGPRQEPLLRALRETYPETFLVMTTDKHGMNVGRSDGKKPQSYSDRKYIKQVLDGAELATEVVISKTIHKPVVTVATPIHDDTGSFVGVLVAVTELTRVAATVGAVRNGSTGLAYVVDSTNHVVAHSEARFAEKLEDFSKDVGVRFLRSEHAARDGATETSLVRDPRSGSATTATDYLIRALPVHHDFGIVLMSQRQEAYAQVDQFVGRALSAMALSLLVVGSIIWWFIAKTLRPVEKLTAAAASLAEGKLDERVSVHAKHEIGRLGSAFNTMAEAIQKHVTALANHQAVLEDTVRERTKDLAHRTNEMRLVLDTVDQGLVTLSREGKIGGERSAAFERWFPETREHHSIARLLAAHDETTAKSLAVGWESLIEGLLPMELNLDQLPKRISVEDRQLALAYKPVLDGDHIRSVLLIVTDVTAELKRLSAESEQREFLNVFERVMKDRSGFIEYFNEATAIVSRFSSQDEAEFATRMREIHTLKGNSAIFGVTSVADLCHEVESRILEEGSDALTSGLGAIAERWKTFSERVVPLIGTESDEIVEVTFSDLDAILTAIQRGEKHSSLAHLVDRLRTEPIEVRFQRLAEQTRGLCRRLGKPEPTIVVDPGSVRLPREGWGGLFGAFIHLLRNAVDHGFEPPEERRLAKKPERGTLSFKAHLEGSTCIIEVSDDGRGIDWEAIAAKARALNLPCDSQEALYETLFANGVTTRAEASSVSGRGAGMGALRDACWEMGGTLTLESTRGKGTLVRLTIPLRPVPLSLASLKPAVRVSLRPASVTPRVST